MHRSILGLLLIIAALASGSALAVQSCELNGERVNPNNGGTTQGKGGLMRCRDDDGGPVVREQELQNGVFMGAVRYFKNGALERDYRVNARGNRDGLAREYAVAAFGARPALVREETLRDGSTVGLVRTWYPGGILKRLAFHGDDGAEQASVEFNEQGQPSGLRCASRPVLGSDFDDGKACGHGSGVSNVVLYGAKGQPRARVAYERGERRRYEQLWDNGSVRELQESGAASGVERSFSAEGIKRKETAWVVEAASGRAAGERPRRQVTLEQEFHESGKLVHEKRWRSGERAGELASEQHWYLNGQPRDLTECIVDNGRPLRRETSFHDNGRKASEGAWAVATDDARYSAQAVGVHRSWDADGRLRGERSFDDKGRVTRERDLDAAGAVVRNDEVFEDGSRKAYGK